MASPETVLYTRHILLLNLLLDIREFLGDGRAFLIGVSSTCSESRAASPDEKEMD